MSQDTRVNELIINKLTQELYDAAKLAGTLSETELYVTPYKAPTPEDIGAAPAVHTHTQSLITDFPTDGILKADGTGGISTATPGSTTEARGDYREAPFVCTYGELIRKVKLLDTKQEQENGGAFCYFSDYRLVVPLVSSLYKYYSGLDRTGAVSSYPLIFLTTYNNNLLTLTYYKNEWSKTEAPIENKKYYTLSVPSADWKLNRDHYEFKISNLEYELDSEDMPIQVTIPRGRMKGDILGNGTISTAGYKYFNEALAHMHDLPLAGTEDFSAWDVNSDGNLDTKDTIVVKQMATNLDNYHFGSYPEITGTWTNILANLNNKQPQFYIDISLTSGLSRDDIDNIYLSSLKDADWYHSCKYIAENNVLRIYAYRCPLLAITTLVATIHANENVDFNVLAVINNNSKIDIVPDDNLKSLMLLAGISEMYIKNEHGYAVICSDLPLINNCDILITVEEVY